MANEEVVNEDPKDESNDGVFENGPALTEAEQVELKEHSADFLGQWNTLISTTNWDKGEIIAAWQKSLEESDLPDHSYSDQRWADMVGGVTPQHVGRLRRTYDRFGHVFGEYKGLYWSHFYAALDWDDAEMWLEGAVQSTWSVSQMRTKRWETLGSIPNDKPKVDHIVVTEAEAEENQALKDKADSEFDREYAEGPRLGDGPDFGDEASTASSMADRQTDALDSEAKPKGPKVRPFESFTNLPDDIASAASSFKVAIIKHKTEEWDEISIEDLHALLDALKKLSTSASE